MPVTWSDEKLILLYCPGRGSNSRPSARRGFKHDQCVLITYSAIDTRVYGGKKHDYWKADLSEINTPLQKVKWEEEMENTGVNQSWRFFKSKIEEVVKNNVPLKDKNKQNPKPPWQTKESVYICKKKTDTTMEKI